MRTATTLLLSLLALRGAGDPVEEARFVAGLADKGLHEEVVREARAFLSEHPRDERADEVRYRLAAALWELGRTADAAEAYAPLAERQGFELVNEARLRLAQCRIALGDPRAAVPPLERLLAGDPGYLEVPASLILADARLELGELDGAAERYAFVLASGRAELDADARWGLAWCGRRRGDAAGTIDAARGFLERHPQDARAAELRFLLGDALLAHGDAAAAARELARVEAGPWADAARTALGHARAAGGDRAGAAAAFAEVLERWPESPLVAEAALHGGVARFEQGEVERALALFAHPSLASDVEGLAWRAEALTRLGRDEEALAVLERALSLEPDAATAVRLQAARGDRLAALGRDDEAVRAWQSAGSQRSVYNAAATRLNAGDARAAETLARELLAARPDGARRLEAELLLGEALFAQDDWRGAEAAFTAALASHGGLGDAAAPERRAESLRARSRVAWCRWLAGDAAGAAERFGALAQDAPDDREAAFMHARAELERGGDAAARAGFARYLERWPDGPHAPEAGVCLARLLDPAEGVAPLKAVLARHASSPLAPLARFELAERLSAGGADPVASPGASPVASSERRARAMEHYAALLREPDAATAAGVDVDAARYGLAWCLYEDGRTEDARRTLGALPASREKPELARAAAELGLWCAARERDADGFARAWNAALDAGVPAERRLGAAEVGAALMVEAGRADDARAVFASFEEAPAPVRARALVAAALTELDLARAAAPAPSSDGEEAAAPDAESCARAERMLDEARKLGARGPDLAQAAFFAGEARFAARAWGQAKAWYRVAADEAAGGELAARALYKEGFAALYAEDLAAAERAFATLCERHAESELALETLFLLGETRWRGERFAEAAAALAELLERAPRHAVASKARLRLGQAQARLGRNDAAAATLAELARTDPGFPNLAEAELERGRALAALSRADDARRAFARTIELDGGALAARARIALGGIARAEGDLETALSEYLKVAVLFGGDEAAEALFLAGEVLEQRGARERALDQYRELVREHAGTPWAERAGRRLRELGG